MHLMIESARLKKTDTVVDIGCGWGNFSKACREFSDKVIGIEPNADNLKEAAIP
ncbi:MAG: class I SAM-dependent methyltransferase [Sphaerochaetaceae bacterium]